MKETNKIKGKNGLFIKTNDKTMEHTNLFLYEDKASLDTKYPAGKIDDIVPGVAYGRADEAGSFDYKVIYNKKKVTYNITVHPKNTMGEVIAEDYIVHTHETLEGQPARALVKPTPIKGYKPAEPSVKLEVTGDTETDFLYALAVETSYTVTVNHMFNGAPIAEPTVITVDDVYEGEVAEVTVTPITLPGYTAETVTLEVSGDTTYSLEYGPDYEWVDLGLPSGTLWASMNVGATKPEEYGYYFAWGETEPDKSSVYNWGNYKYGTEDDLTKYNDADGLMALDAEDDAVRAYWGSGWCLPSKEQLQELGLHTTSAWTTDYNGTGVAGMILTSKAAGNTNSIFLPAAGGIFTTGHAQEGQTAAMWTLSLGDNKKSHAWDLNAKSNEWDVSDGGDTDRGRRYYGFPVRGVKNLS